MSSLLVNLLQKVELALESSEKLTPMKTKLYLSLKPLIFISLLLNTFYSYPQEIHYRYCYPLTSQYGTGHILDMYLPTNTTKHSGLIKFGQQQFGIFCYMGWAMFDISEIPTNAIIHSIKLSMKIKNNSSSSSIEIGMANMVLDPRRSDLYAFDILSYYADNPSPYYKKTVLSNNNCDDCWMDVTLENTKALQDLSDAVKNGYQWWGLIGNTTTCVSKAIDFYGNDADLFYQPFLTIGYSLPPNLTFASAANALNVSGTNVDLSLRVVNNGGNPTSGCYVAYYLSNNSTIETTDYEIGRDYIPSLGAGSYSDQSLRVNVAALTPLIPAGSYYVGYIIDYQNSVDESNENDNTYLWSSPRITITLPNLIYGKQLNSLTVSGSTVGLSMRVINVGGSSAVRFSIAYYLSLNSTITTSDYKIGEDYISILAPNGYKDELLVVDVSTITPSIPTGTYHVGYIIDYQNSVRESDETDNLYAWSSPQVIISSLNSPPNKPQLLTPENGTSWSTTFNLTWQCTDPDPGDILNYTVRVRPKGATTWNRVSVGTRTSYTISGWSSSDLGTYEWSIIASDGEDQSISDIREFTLVAINNPPNKPRLLTPGNGTSWSDPFSLSWSCSDPDPIDELNYTIRIRLKGTSSWDLLSVGTQTSFYLSGWNNSELGTYEWSIEASDGKEHSTSDTWEFTLVSSTITVISPNGEETWPVGSNQNITWTSSGTSGSVRIELSTNNGSNWLYIVPTTPDNGSYPWTVSNTPSTNCLIRISDTDGSPSDMSDAPFTIVRSYFTITPANHDVPSSSGTISFDVASNITWTASSNQTWCTVTSSGSGNGTITATYQTNTEPGTRTATITISGTGVNPQNVTVTQSGISNSPPDKPTLSTPYNVSSNSLPFRFSWTCSDPDGDELTYVLKTRMIGESNWIDNIMNTQNYLDVISIHHDYYNIPMEWCVVASDSETESTSDVWEYIIITNQLIVSPDNQNVGVEAGNTNFSITTDASWVIADYAPWLSVSPSKGQGNVDINVTYSANNSIDSRIGSIIVTEEGYNPRMKTVTITQAGTSPTLTVSPLNQDASSSSGTVSFDVASNINWTVSSDQTWCTVTTSGTGNGTITATYQTNTEPGTRTATITVSGSGVNDQIVTVTQAGTSPTLTVSPLNQDASSSSGTVSFDVASNINWTVSSDRTWCTVTPSGTGNGTITATYQTNTGPGTRTATITVSGSGVNNQVVTVTQLCSSPEQPESIAGKSRIIKNSTETYSIQPVTGASSYTWVLPMGWNGNSTSTSILITTNEDAISGNISVVANNDCGSSEPGILYVEVGDCVTPQISLKWDDVLICSNIDDIFLSYQWFNGAIPIPGANEQYYVTSKQPGIYKVETIDINGCREMSNEITVTGSKSLTVYPNPAKSSFTVSIIDQPVGKVNLRIINSTGMKIMDIETEKADIEFLKEIPADDLEEGFYIVQVIIDQTYLYNSKILVIK